MTEFVEKMTVKSLEAIGNVAVKASWLARVAAETSVWRSFGCCKSIKLAVVVSLIYLLCLL